MSERSELLFSGKGEVAGESRGVPNTGGVYVPPSVGVGVPGFVEIREPRKVVDGENVGVDREDFGNVKGVRGSQYV